MKSHTDNITAYQRFRGPLRARECNGRDICASPRQPRARQRRRRSLRPLLGIELASGLSIGRTPPPLHPIVHHHCRDTVR